MKMVRLMGIIAMVVLGILLGFMVGCEILQQVTGGNEATTPPRVVSVSPPDGATGVPINTSIIIEFSETMDEGATEGSITIVPSIDGTFSWSSQSSVLTFTPDGNLASDETYNVKIGTGAKDLAGNELESPYLFLFKTGSGIDNTPPSDVNSFVATAGDGQVELSWENPSDSDFAGVKVIYRDDTYPVGPNDGTEIYKGSGISFTHIGLTNGTTYYYAIYTYDSMYNYSNGVTASATPYNSGDVIPPGVVTNLTAIPGDTQVELSWENPTDTDFVGVVIIYRTDRYPTTLTDGSQIYDGNGTSFIHTGLINGTTYYYTFFSYDASNNFSSGVNIEATPASVYQIYAQQDAYVTNDGSNSGKNWNTEYLKFGNLPSFPSYQYYVLVQFDVSNLPADVTEAKMRFYFKGRPGSSYGYATAIAVYRNTSSWDETTVTNNNAPSYDGNAVTNVTGIYWPLSTDGSYVEFDITSLYNAWKNGTYTNYGVTMRPTASTGGGGWYTCDFISSENTTYPDYVPVLIVTK